MATHSSVLAREIPWTEEPGGLQSVGSQQSNTMTKQQQLFCMFVNFFNFTFGHAGSSLLHGLSIDAASRGYSSLQCADSHCCGFSRRRPRCSGVLRLQ